VRHFGRTFGRDHLQPIDESARPIDGRSQLGFGPRPAGFVAALYSFAFESRNLLGQCGRIYAAREKPLYGRHGRVNGVVSRLMAARLVAASKQRATPRPGRRLGVGPIRLGLDRINRAIG
jgi:hypothetical protein